jgi:hypothetical protein
LFHDTEKLFEKLRNFVKKTGIIDRVSEDWEIVVPDIDSSIENKPTLFDAEG